MSDYLLGTVTRLHAGKIPGTGKRRFSLANRHVRPLGPPSLAPWLVIENNVRGGGANFATHPHPVGKLRIDGAAPALSHTLPKPT
jgi:hypothetical protein